MQIVNSAVVWLLNYQTSEGAFVETEYYWQVPLHQAMAPKAKVTRTATTNNNNNSNSSSSSGGGGLSHVALTAHVLIALEDTAAFWQVNRAHY